MDDETLPLFPNDDWKKYRIRRGWGVRTLRRQGPRVAVCTVCGTAYYPYNPRQYGCSTYCSAVLIFWKHVEKTDSCWLWTGTLLPAGYGQFGTRDKKHLLAHRFSYELHVGPIPDGLVIDHLCRTRACVNPAHLEAVSQLENNLRGHGWVAINTRKTHCKHGHLFDEANTRWTKDGRERVCRTCAREWMASDSATKRHKRTRLDGDDTNPPAIDK